MAKKVVPKVSKKDGRENKRNLKFKITIILSVFVVLFGVVLLIFNVALNNNNSSNNNNDEYISYELKDENVYHDKINYLIGSKSDNYYKEEDVELFINKKGYLVAKSVSDDFSRVFEEFGEIKNFVQFPSNLGTVFLTKSGEIYGYYSDPYWLIAEGHESYQQEPFKQLKVESNVVFKDVILLETFLLYDVSGIFLFNGYMIIGVGENGKYYNFSEAGAEYNSVTEIIEKSCNGIVGYISLYSAYTSFSIDINGNIKLVYDGKTYDNKILLPNGEKPIIKKAFVEENGQDMIDLYLINSDNKLYRIPIQQFKYISISTEYELKEVREKKIKSISYPNKVYREDYKATKEIKDLTLEFEDGSVMIFDKVSNYGFNLIEGVLS